MKRLAAVLLALSACKPIAVGSGRYACNPDQGREPGSAQCPGESRCGLEGVCHDLGDTSSRWRCETALDCEGGWLCGVSADGETRECHDPQAPEAFRCQSSADCSAGWTCGLDEARLRRCHDPSSPRAWPCDTRSDCAGGWECGLRAAGGRECHDPTRPEAWVCLTDADCGGGWRCGLNDLRTGRECHDPAAPRAFACEGPSDCLGGWACGLNDARTARECHDPAAPRAFACEEPSDCLGNWVCGLNDARTARQCHDPAAPRAFACLTHADCVAGWQCGLAANRLQRECHDPSAPQAWACDDDLDCLGGWRCDVRRACVDPRRDALEPTGPLDGGDAATLNPVSAARYDRAAIAPASSLGGPVRVALSRAGRLEALGVDSVSASVRIVDLGPSSDGPLLVQSPRSIDFAFNRFTEVVADRVYEGRADGGVVAYLLDLDGGVQVRLLRNTGGGYEISTPVTKLRHGVAERDLLPSLVGFSESPATGFVVFDGPAAAADFSYPARMRTPGNVIHDLVHVITRDGGLECLLALDESGIWARQFMAGNNWNFEQVQNPTFGNDTCATTGLKPSRLLAASPTHVAVGAVPRDGGRELLALWSLTPMLTRGTSAFDSYCTSNNDQPCTQNDRIPFTVEYGPCDPCPVGALDGVVPVAAASGPPALEVRCTVDGGLPSFFRVSRRALSATGCDRQPLVGPSNLFSQPVLFNAEQPTLGRFLLTGSTGSLWTGSSVAAATALSFDRAATGVAFLGANTRDLIVFGERVNGVPEPRFGVVAFPAAASSAVAANEPSWVLSGESLTTLSAGPTLSDALTFGLLATPVAEPRLVRRARASSGATVAVVTGGGAIATAEVDAALARQVPFATLQVRATAPGPFSSLAFPAGDTDGGVWLEGYAVSPGSVARLTAESPSRWVVQPVPLPAPLFPLAVWYEGSRARVGMATGVVYALPSAVLVGGALPGGVAVAYAQACQHQLALAPDGLYRLTLAAGATVGRWEPVPLPAGFGGGDLLGGTVHSVGADVYVFSRMGEAARLTVSPCAP